MKKIFQKSIWVSSLFLLMFAANSCMENTDLITENAKSGGLVNPSGLIAYKLGLTPTFDINVEVPKGAAVEKIKVSYYYMRMSDTTMSNTLTFDIPINGANVTEAINKVLPYTWSSLRDGITLPSDP